ncbi:host attachment family protein [Fulvimarina sp. 2208YS6-2-32]|uniref:Host attachment family protein n=1 Tax=Fulvimarina uroteuthidis TaxID=3098149 RepID=A0ABU5I6J4_9HYPH|nr:host attachment family protein [Fulvimarina sp. 2208YS6-2-32]MDY8110378.1 host attachment family protein [Fulvimarina sp. 2208YS6-2-32]
MSSVKIGYETWVLIADGEKALFLKNLGDEELPNFEIQRVEEQENPSDSDQSANRPGRGRDGGKDNPHSSAFQDTDWHELAKDRFAAELGEILYKMAYRKRFDRIVLVASPSTLGELRGQLHKEVSDRVVGEVAKDLTNHPIGKIEDILTN